jgi:ketosteroid isomerase-like protein
MKHFLAIALAALTVISKAQTNVDPNLKSLIDAEWSFIKIAKEKNTRDAFIESLADDAVTFGQDIQKGKDNFKAQQPNESWLYWQPVYSVIAASGDFGFNTGPWEFRTKRADEKPVAFGQFVTVWKKVNGEWKAAIDIGISHDTPVNKETWKTSKHKSLPSKPVENKNDIMEFEKQFQDELAQYGNATYKKFLSSEARFYRQKREPFTLSGEITDFLGSAEKVTFKSVDGEIASSGDLAFVYGRSIVHEKTDRNSFFMRIWRKENGSWRIVLDLVN